MSRQQLQTVASYLRRLIVAHTDGTRDDGRLLELAGRGEESAFAALVGRHGPLVWRLCRNLLGHEQDAEDAFQATFLVLARKAKSIRKKESLHCWLYGVAHRIAMKTRKAAAQRRARERKATSSRQNQEAPATASLHELQAIVDEEVGRLPEKYRQPFVLCCLEGKSKPEAARELGWKEGTVSGRLARARALLQQRLTRRGVALSAALSAVALQPEVSSSAPLIAATTRAAVAFASSKVVPAGLVSTKVLTLANAALRSMVLAKAKSAVGVLMLAGVLLGGGAFAYQGANVTGHGIRLVAKDEDGDRDREAGRKDNPAAQRAKKGKDSDEPKDTWPATAAAWKQAGAVVGWLRLETEYGLWVFVPENEGRKGDFTAEILLPLWRTWYVPEKEGRKGDLPAFQFESEDWNEDKLARLPAPEAAFGLSLVGHRVTDAGLEKLARFKNLHVLRLDLTETTGTGLKKLTGLRGLDLHSAVGGFKDGKRGHVTLKALARLKDLQSLNLSMTDVTDEGLKELAGLKGLQTLNLLFTDVTDVGLKELAGLQNLRTLWLGCNRVTDAGMKHLAGLKDLRTLLLMCDVSDAGVKHLAGLKDLRALYLITSEVTEEGLKVVARFKNLHTLDVGYTVVTNEGLHTLAELEHLQDLTFTVYPEDAGLRTLAELKHLHTLRLNGLVTNEGLKFLAGIKTLRRLELIKTQVTDKGLKYLAELKNLTRLECKQLTPEAREKLRKALPDCAILPRP